MPSKTEEYLALAQRTANGLTRYWESWTDYLTTASRLYKYSFPDQLMIYAQRPDATACADYDIWNNRMNRYVRRGSKGIALLDQSSNVPRLHYVFDVSDTGVRRNSRDPEVWQLNDDLFQPVSEMLAQEYGIHHERLSQQIADIAGKLAESYWDNNSTDILAIVDGSFLMDYDDAGQELQFKSAAAISIMYTILERCGFEPEGYFDRDDFQAIYDFSTPDAVYALGTAVSDCSRDVLRNIERTVKTTIRRRNVERSQHEYEEQERDLLDHRGLPAPEPDPQPAEDPVGQVRQDAPDVPDEPSPGAVQHDAPEREPVPAPDGSGADSREPDAADHGAASETDPGPGQGEPANGMGAAHEQPESAGRGTGADGADLQLSFLDANIPTEAQQIEKIDQAESEKTPSAFVLSQAEIENELRRHGSGFAGGKQRIMALYQTQPDRKLRAKALAKEYGIGGHSHDFLDGSRGFVNHDGRGLEFDHYPEHKKFTLSWTQVEKYIDLMIQSDRYLTDKEKEHYTPPAPVNAKPDGALDRAKNLIREFCQEEYDSEPDFSDLSKIGIAYTNATDEDIPIQVNVDLVGYRVERYLGEVLIDERQYESLEDLTETELEALDFSELVSVTDEELEHYHSKAEERPALLPLDAAAEYNALKEQHPDALVGFEQNGQFEFYGEDARKVCELVGGKLLEKETELGTVPVTGFPTDQWAYRAKQLWQCGENVYLAGLNEDGTHHQTKYLRREDYLPLGTTVHMEGRAFRVDNVNFDKGSVTLQDVALAEMRMPVFREEPLALVRELYEEQDMMGHPLPDYKVGDNVIVDLPTRTIEGKIGYVGETDVRIDTGAHGQSWDNEVINKRQFEGGLRQVEPELSDEELDELPISAVIDGEVQTFPDAAALDEARNAEPALEPAGNFRITDDHLGEGGAKQKYARNIEAIRTLFKLEEEHRGATAEEQQVLSQYVGWGGLADAFDPNKDGWAKEYTELKGLLSEDEYAAARSSTLNAHYTSPTVIHAIYDAVEKIGFRSGNILEPSMGVGNFFGMLPDTMQGSRLYGVELDSITGRIAQKLYPQADITVAGFETTDRRDFYDLAVGNVPFGNYKVADKAYNKFGFSIHNYFFAKAIDQVRPGGIVAFVTSRYTMDSKDSTARKHIAERADLLGAIRLPNNAFRANAGTDVVSDIIFLQKRDRPADIEPAWAQLGKTEDGFAINSYFVEHPEMVLGELTTESTQYGHDLTVAPIEGAVLSEQLAEAVQHIEGHYAEVEVETPDIADAEAERKTLPADPDVKNFSYAVVDGEVYYRENSIMTQIELSDTAKARVTGMVELRQIVNELIEQQLDDYPDSAVQETQARLNAAYDAFTAKHGLINDRRNARLFEQDSSYYLLCSLENLDENKQLKSKADMFTKRTIRPERTITSVDTPSEALAVSMGEHGRVDLPYMAELLGTPGEYERITTELSGVIFKDPSADPTDPEAGWQMADEYLSGDVRTKLRIAQLAAETNPEFKVNVTALEKAQPKELEASEIDVRLGATWIAPEIIQKFMQETFQVPYYLRHDVNVRFSPYTAEWRVQGKSALGHGDIMSTETYGTHRANAYKILEDTLNLKDVRIYDTIEDAEGKPKRVLNKNETTLAQQKQQAIKDAFANWIWQDPQRRISLVRKYNELFNSTRPREYDGNHIHFVGMNPEISLREHQRNAIAHVLYGGNTLLAHEVGAGKTFEMAASAMEAKRLGLCQKSLFVVPNHLTEQWASEFLHLYPNAKLLVARRKDFETANRKKFCARIATGDYDAIIIGHSQFERIPLSFERQERIIQDQIAETLLAINELKANAGENFTIKQMERTRKTLEAKLDKLRADSRKDDVITFEQLGVDRLFVDESHFYKNLFLTTKMRNVAGLSTSEAQKSSDMFGKCRYLDEITGGRGVVFATGTPVSNSMTELYTVMRYLQYSTLQQKMLTHFDCWASTFGETTTAIELAPEGTGYRARTRFAKFFNLPELMSMFKEVADIKTSDQLHLPVPDAKFETVVVKPSETQKAMVQELSRRAAEIHSGNVDASVDNMLCVTNDGRKIGLDVRLMNPMLPDDPNSKLNVCVRNVLKIWEEGKDQKLTQLLFCDLSTPKNDGNFNVYDDIRKKLIAAGVPESEIEFIHNADTEAKKATLFSKVRSGDVRVLLGSTAKMGAGTNVQQRLVAVHHLDVGWKPSDMTQRNGRIIRQGNMNKEVKVFNYVTEGTFDSYLFQTLENKQRFISQIMTSKSPVRSCDDVDEQALSYAEIKALCAGNPLIKEKMDLDVQVAKLKVLKADHQSQKFRLEDKLLTKFPAEIQEQTAKIAALKSDAEIAAVHPQDKENFCGMVIKGMTYDEKKTAGERLILACMELPNTEEQVVGSYRGFELSLRFDTFHNEHQALLKGTLKYPVPLGSDPHGNIVRLDNALSNFADRSTAAENELDTLRQQQAAAQVEVAKPFPQEEELAQKSARLAELNAQLDVDEKHHEPEQDEEEKEDAPRRSVLAVLEEKAEKAEPVKPFKSYLDKDGDAR
ncbi:DEAD/DEAH box helicase family protein [Faecalibacterium prausnitzii]|jgi:N12 class adenine-specific DNA methylase/adenine-specific DNA methylase|uniref:DEAD/DEAH box helicase family protein n=1 Tax=Faecalibacterium prausnitzii TaxID=853 RepID=UPI003F68A734